MKNTSIYTRMRILGAIEYAQGDTITERIRSVAQSEFADEDGNMRRFTERTLSTWYYRHKLHGMTAMQPKPRSDKGKTRKVSPEAVAEAIEQVRALWHDIDRPPPKLHIYRACLERGLLLRSQVAPNTFSRLVNQFDLLKPEAQSNDKRRLAFSKQFANQMWQGDTMYGPHVVTPAGHKPTYLIAFIDDASRVLCHGEFFLGENTSALMRALRSALYKRGVPEQIYVDNGSIYASKEMIVVCARIGCLLCHTPVRDGSAKGKIERFFRTVREAFLLRQLDLSSLEALNRQFLDWAENEYNSRVHSTLGMRPIDRFGLDLSRIRYLPPCEANDELFYVEEDRHVKNDNTFSLQGRRYEAPCDLRNKSISVRFDRTQPSTFIVYYKDQRMGEAHLLDPTQNDRAPKALKGATR